MPEFTFKPTPNEEAATFLRGKPVVSQEVYARMLPEVQALSFTVAGVESFDTLQRVRDNLAEVPRGGDWRKIKAEIAEDLGPWLGSDKAANARAELLLRMHGMQSYRVGQWERVQRQKDVFPYLQYRGTRDSRTRDSHRVLDGLVLPVDDPFWKDHMPPWEWGCRCRVTQVDQEKFARLQAEDAEKPPEERRIPTDTERERMRTEGMLTRTIKADPDSPRAGVPTRVNVKSPKERGQSGPGTVENLRIPLADLRDRYDEETWAQFEDWAKRQEIEGQGRTVWGWLDGEEAVRTGVAPGRAAALTAAMGSKILNDLAGGTGPAIAAADLAAAVRAAPDHPVAKDLRIWSEDKETFARMKWGQGQTEREWRDRMVRILQGLAPAPVASGRLYRGMRESAVLKSIRADKMYSVTTVGESFSEDISIATGDYLTGDGYLVEVVSPQAARPMAAVFAELGGKAAAEREAIYPQGATLILLEERLETVEIAGKSVQVPYLIMEEE